MGRGDGENGDVLEQGDVEDHAWPSEFCSGTGWLAGKMLRMDSRRDDAEDAMRWQPRRRDACEEDGDDVLAQGILGG